MFALRPWLAPRCLLMLLLCVPGCGSGFLAHAIVGSPKVKALYELEDRPTLILVDDPGSRFTDPNLPFVVATNIEHHLRENEAVTSRIVSTHELATLAAELGEAYKKTPVDELGRTLDAEQVVYVLIEEVSMQSAPGMYRPTVTAQVKVIDTATGHRLFPDPPSINDPSAPSRGRSIATQMSHRGVTVPTEGASMILKRQLAETLGRDVARMFYTWKTPEVGSRFDER